MNALQEIMHSGWWSYITQICTNRHPTRTGIISELENNTINCIKYVWLFMHVHSCALPYLCLTIFLFVLISINITVSIKLKVISNTELALPGLTAEWLFPQSLPVRILEDPKSYPPDNSRTVCSLSRRSAWRKAFWRKSGQTVNISHTAYMRAQNFSAFNILNIELSAELVLLLWILTEAVAYHNAS